MHLHPSVWFEMMTDGSHHLYIKAGIQTISLSQRLNDSKSLYIGFQVLRLGIYQVCYQFPAWSVFYTNQFFLMHLCEMWCLYYFSSYCKTNMSNKMLPRTIFDNSLKNNIIMILWIKFWIKTKAWKVRFSLCFSCTSTQLCDPLSRCERLNCCEKASSKFCDWSKENQDVRKLSK